MAVNVVLEKSVPKNNRFKSNTSYQAEPIVTDMVQALDTVSHATSVNDDTVSQVAKQYDMHKRN